MREVDEVVSEMRKMVDQGLSIDKFLRALLRQWGGYDALATDFYRCFVAADVGGQTQARMLADFLKLVLSRTVNEEDDDEMEISEIDRQIDKQLSEGSDGE